MRNPWFSFVWFAIPVIGMPPNAVMVGKAKKTGGAKTFVDKIRDGIWKSAEGIAIVLTVVCLVFHLCGYPQAWLAMFFYAFIAVGFGAAMQGILFKEPSYVFGGLFSVLAGLTVTTAAVCGIPLYMLYPLKQYIDF